MVSIHPTPELIHALLPGPSRKRRVSLYSYRLFYKESNPHQAGCVLVWDVLGGREVYQIALERQANGGLRWHCTCADAVFRGDNPQHCCKHVRGLIRHGRLDGCDTLPQPVKESCC